MRKLLKMFHFPRHYPTLYIDKNKSIVAHNVTTPAKTLAHNGLGFAFLFGLLGISFQASALNRIQTENALPGSSAWYEFYVLGSNAADNVHGLEGYADKDSVNVGGSISFYVNANPSRYPTYSITVYRLGWYGGMGGRKMMDPVSRASESQIIPTPDPVTGLVQANWTNPYTLNIPSTWTSGIYIATIVGDGWEEGRYIPFVVRDVNRTSDYLFQSSTTTYQAYNAWGGKSLYGYNSDSTPVNGQVGTNVPARKISFNRPYDVGGGLGSLLNWEINMLYFMEKEGYDVTYQSNTDTHEGDGGLLNHKAVLSVGHDEYWSKDMRDNFENARAHGISLGFFGANDAYWQTRTENNNRTLISYKDFAVTEDPLAIDTDTSNNHLITSRWRNGAPGDFRPGANLPENALIGVMYAFGPRGTSVLNTNIISTKSDPNRPQWPSPHWVYNNTRVQVGEVFPGLLGYEADRIFDNGSTPAGLEIIAASPVPVGVIDHDSPASANYDPANPKSHMTVYSKACSITPCQNPVSTVFATGSIQWVWGLNTSFKWPYIDPIASVQGVARNVLARMVNPPALAAASTATTPSGTIPITLAETIPSTVAAAVSNVLAAIIPTASAAAAPAKNNANPNANFNKTKLAKRIIDLIKHEQSVEKLKLKKHREKVKGSDEKEDI